MIHKYSLLILSRLSAFVKCRCVYISAMQHVMIIKVNNYFLPAIINVVTLE